MIDIMCGTVLTLFLGFLTLITLWILTDDDGGGK